MLREERAILPEDIQKQIEWDKLEGVIVLGLKKKGEANVIAMSSLTIEEAAFLSKQLDAHVAYLLGPMREH